MLPNDVPCGGLEAYERGVTYTNVFWVKMGKNIESIYGRSRPYIYLPLIYFFLGQHAMPRGNAFSEWYVLCKGFCFSFVSYLNTSDLVLMTKC